MRALNTEQSARSPGVPAPRFEAPITRVTVAAYTIPTDSPESDGTFEWHKTTMVLGTLTANGVSGMGFSYASESAAELIQHPLADRILKQDAMAVQANWATMVKAIRNLGR